MQIVIPMSGFGERFRRVGYAVPKPLIEIEGKPIIAHVVDMFPGETDFIFICNSEHLNEPSYRMAEILKQCCPTGRIVGIAPHRAGPVHAVQQVAHLLDPQQPVVVNYCDFTCYWDWPHFKQFVRESRCDGAIPAYKGFHPHSLGSTNYAYMQETDGWVSDIREKQPFTANRMNEYASSGTYYFASAGLMLESFAEMQQQGLQVGGEYYVSLAYKPLLDKGRSVAVYSLQHFMQWGTPEDVREYEYWSRAFRGLLHEQPADAEQTQDAVILPMAGLGQRFADQGYSVTKPLIEVSGQAMVVQAVNDLPAASQHVFVLRRDMPGAQEVAHSLQARFAGTQIHLLDGVTEGQACTTLIGLQTLLQAQPDFDGPVTVGACDNGAIYDRAAFTQALQGDDADVLVWGIRGYPNAARHPRMYGWIDEVEGLIQNVSVKQPLADTLHDPIVLGAFTFKRAADMQRCIERLIAQNHKVNGEYYMDSAINMALELGLRCRLFEVHTYLCWGTPDDLRTFEYWQSCFHKWATHPYRMEHDANVTPSSLAALLARYAKLVPPLLKEARA